MRDALGVWRMEGYGYGYPFDCWVVGWFNVEELCNWRARAASCVCYIVRTYMAGLEIGEARLLRQAQDPAAGTFWASLRKSCWPRVTAMAFYEALRVACQCSLLPLGR